MLKVVGFIIWSLICLAFALIPEAVMYFLWGVIDPVTAIERLLVIAVFLIGGGSISVLFAFLGVALWANGVKEMF